MPNLMRRPYRNQKVIQDRQKKSERFKAERAAKLQARASAIKETFPISIPPVLDILVEESLAGTHNIDNEAASEGSEKR